MANHTFMRLYGLDIRKKLYSMDYNLPNIAIPTAVATAADALLGVTYGSTSVAPKPSSLAPVGYEIVLQSVVFNTAQPGAGDGRNKWDFKMMDLVSEGTFRFSLPGRDDTDPDLYDSVNPTLWSPANTVWVNFTNALADAHVIPISPDDIGANSSEIQAALADTRSTVRPRLRG